MTFLQLILYIFFLFTIFFFRAQLNYDLSLFVVKNLCYIFMLIHSLSPGMVYVLTGKPCGHLVAFSNEKKKVSIGGSRMSGANDLVDGGISPSSSNEIELVPMRTPTSANSQPRNLNRVSLHQACESGDENSP